jgi:hypothetical protein
MKRFYNEPIAEIEKFSLQSIANGLDSNPNYYDEEEED